MIGRTVQLAPASHKWKSRERLKRGRDPFFLLQLPADAARWRLDTGPDGC